MGKKNCVKSDRAKKEKKKPKYETYGFILEIPEDVLQDMLREASKSKHKKE